MKLILENWRGYLNEAVGTSREEKIQNIIDWEHKMGHGYHDDQGIENLQSMSDQELTDLWNDVGADYEDWWQKRADDLATLDGLYDDDEEDEATI
jgi:hypothetical protein